MGLADYFFAKKLRYGSPESIREIDRLYSFIRDTAYEASIKLAEEKGSFPKYDPIMLSKSKFVRRMPKYLQRMVKEIGLRNVTLTSAQPTGTTSLLVDVTSGIEPLFAKGYRRRDRVGERIYIHPLAVQFLENGEPFPEWYVSSEDITPKEHLEVQAAVQRYIDSSVSKTINCPKGTTAEQLSDYILEYIRDLKGVTVYVDQSREEQVLYYLTEEEIKQNIGKASGTRDEEEVKCKAGTCEV